MRRAFIQCHSCRYAVLDTFATLAGVSVPKTSLQNLRNTSPQWRRPLSTSSVKWSTIEHQENEASQYKNTTSSPDPKVSSSSVADTIPWYLQIPNPTPPGPSSLNATSQHSLAAQEIPPIPSDAPSILLPILTHLSTIVGLDNLTLLDLRHLTDPPPALGANLIMIIGTARSTKHLNVSADRFCRWCRSEYRLKPFADGLLGRNELKLKLRRRARRLKLAQSVGNTVAMNSGGEGTDVDDGITTGWICVNLGAVEDRVAEHAEERESDILESAATEDIEDSSVMEEDGKYQKHLADLTFVGFGRQSTAPRIVVQMLIESKRAELDLEALWDTRKAGRLKREERLEKQIGLEAS